MTDGRAHDTSPASLVAYYEDCLARHGDSHRGVAWPDADGAAVRYDVMLDVIRGGAAPVTLLDVGCGTGHLLDHIVRRERPGIDYSGLDISDRFIAVARTKHPGTTWYRTDLLADGPRPPSHDYVVLNGVFTVKHDLAFGEMWDFMTALIDAVAPLTRRGMAFNVMSAHVDWTREDLFHVPHDALAAFLISRFGRTFVMRNDYGLYEYTVYVYPGGR